MTIQTPSDSLPLAVRVWQEPVKDATSIEPKPTGRQRQAMPAKWPANVLVFDTETTTDPTQRLTFGMYRYGRWRSDGAIGWLEEGVFVADDLAERDPDAHETLQTFAQRAAANGDPDAPVFKFHTRAEFVEQVLWRAYQADALICGFNLPFDLSRIAVGWSPARGKFAGGFSFTLWEHIDAATGEHKPHQYRPRLRIKSIDSKRARIAFGSVSKREPNAPRGGDRFLDLRTLAFALSNEGHTLLSAGKAFKAWVLKQAPAQDHGRVTPEYIAYNRQDVEATGSLLEALRRDYDLHPIDVRPDRAYSSASIVKAYLKAMGMTPALDRQPDFPREVLGQATSAYFGGRAEVHIRCYPVLVVYLDVLSMYPTVNTLLGLSGFLIADHIDVIDCTNEARQLLNDISVDELADPQTWKELAFFAEIAPNRDILPVRAQYSPGGGFTIGVNPVAASDGLWYAGPDLVAAKVLTGKVPQVIRAFRIVPHGRQAGLKPVQLRGAVTIDPTSGDFFRTVIEVRKSVKNRTDLAPEERRRLDKFLKVLANSGSYGIFAEQNRQERPPSKPDHIMIYGLGDPFGTETLAPEDPGAFCFPPLASITTGAARLMLAMIEAKTVELGGTYAFCDTDSMAIVATESGGVVATADHANGRASSAITALSWAQVDDVIRWVDRLNPYDRSAEPDAILKIEDQNVAPCGITEHPSDCICTKQRQQLWCYGISAKRYALYVLDEHGEPVIVKPSQHGLGHLLNPTDMDSDDREWMTQLWEGIVREAIGLPWTPASWLARPAISRITISSPVVMQAFEKRNMGLSYADAIKPYNFILSAHIMPNGGPTETDPEHFHLVTDFATDARQWTKRRWSDIYSGERFAITTKGATGGEGVARVQSYADVLARYRTHPEPKSRAVADGSSGRSAVGLLERRPVTALSVVGIGKEANKLAAVEAKLIHSMDEVLQVFEHPSFDEWRDMIVPTLKKISAQWLAEQTGLALSTIKAVRNGHAVPHFRNRDKLVRTANACPLDGFGR